MRRISYLLGICILAAGCGHTNKLAQNNVRRQPVSFRVQAAGQGTASADISTQQKGVLGNLAAGLGNGAISNEVAQKLNRAANPNALAQAAANGFQNGLTSYLQVVPQRGAVDTSKYIGETALLSYSLTSDSSGIFAKISVRSRLINRQTAEIVWEDQEDESVPLSGETVSGGGSIMSIVHAAQLEDMSEEQISRVLAGAATDAGLRIGETLRQDVAALATH